MKRPPDHYETLGIEQDATQQDVRAAYRRLARTYHPDRYEGKGDSGATMVRINQAYETLSDPESRSQYDASMVQAPQPRSSSTGDAGLNIAGHRPWFLLWVVLSLVVVALGWVALRTMVPAPVQAPRPVTVQHAPVDERPLAPVPPIEPWKPPPPTARVGLPETEPVKRLIREGTLP